MLTSATRQCGAAPLLPAYFYPGRTWRDALAEVGPGEAIIVNPDNGPGKAPDPNYTRTVARAESSGATLLGYIDTRYAKVSRASIARQVEDYRRWYGITDVFFDDVTTAASRVGYYRAASDAVRQTDPGAWVVLNPGTYPAQAYMSLHDTLVVFEGSERSFLADPPPAWMASYPTRDFAMIVSAVPAGDEGPVTALALRRRAGYVYITDHATTSTLYEQLPTYWADEVRTLEASSAACSPSAPKPTMGYWVLTRNGSVEGYGTAGGSTRVGRGVARASAGLSPDPSKRGFWLATTNGHVYQEAGAPFLGSPAAAGRSVGNSIVGIAADPGCDGYWVATSTGRVFDYGCAAAPTATRRLARVTGIASDASGHGFWLATSNGHVYQEDGAPFLGSPFSRHRRARNAVVGVASDPQGDGYWVVTSNGHVFNYGRAPFAGSPISRHHDVGGSVVGMAPTPDGHGYWLFTEGGGVLSFGDAVDLGSPSGSVVAGAPSR